MNSIHFRNKHFCTGKGGLQLRYAQSQFLEIRKQQIDTFFQNNHY